MPSCAVADCIMNDKKNIGQRIIYHRFPRDEFKKKQWILACKRGDPFNINNARVCSKHFKEEDYQRDLMNELLGRKQRKLLKPDAVPSLKLPMCPEEEPSNKKSSTQQLSCEKKSPVRILPKPAMDDTHGEANAFITSPMCIEIGDSMDERKRREKEVSKRCLEAIESFSCKKRLVDRECQTEDNYELREHRFNQLQRKYENLIKSHMNSEKAHKNMTQKLKEQISKLKIENHKMKNQTETVLSKVFTEAQIRLLLSDKSRCVWSATDIAKALVVRSLSRTSYDFVRKKMQIPLPSNSTLQRWTKSFKCRPGILENVLELIKEKSLTLPPRGRYCVLCFDELNLNDHSDQQPDKDSPSCKKTVLIAMIRGLTANWKQLVYYNFDVKMSPELVKQIICSVESSQFPVLGIVCDTKPANRSLMNDLGVTFSNPYFNNPYEANGEKKIFAFHDASYLLSLMRNHLLHHGLFLPSLGDVINKDLLKRLVDKQNIPELESCLNLSNVHLSVSGTGRQCVILAKEIFSSQTATALRLLNYENEANFFHLVNSAFEILNSCVSVSEIGNSSNMAFDSVLAEQQKILDEFYKEISNMRVYGEKGMLPFQEGFLINVEALKGLYANASEDIGLSYILMARCSKDCVENLFSQVRSMLSAHPTRLEIESKLRLLILGVNDCNQTLSSSSSMWPSEDSIQCLTASCFTKDLFSMTTLLKQS